jgi:putative ABC transport system substrate-binding protein
MRRRTFLAILGGAVAGPLAVRAQQPGRTYRIGFVVPVARDAPAIVAFLDELRLRGFIEGQNLVILPGGFEVRNEQIAELVAAMVRTAPDAILSGGDFTIPLMVMTEDLTAGFAASLARPGGNMTGISLMSADLDA